MDEKCVSSLSLFPRKLKMYEMEIKLSEQQKRAEQNATNDENETMVRGSQMYHKRLIILRSALIHPKEAKENER